MMSCRAEAELWKVRREISRIILAAGELDDRRLLFEREAAGGKSGLQNVPARKSVGRSCAVSRLRSAGQRAW
jgi:hypothetical protein